MLKIVESNWSVGKGLMWDEVDEMSLSLTFSDASEIVSLSGFNDVFSCCNVVFLAVFVKVLPLVVRDKVSSCIETFFV